MKKLTFCAFFALAVMMAGFANAEVKEYSQTFTTDLTEKLGTWTVSKVQDWTYGGNPDWKTAPDYAGSLTSIDAPKNAVTVADGTHSEWITSNVSGTPWISRTAAGTALNGYYAYNFSFSLEEAVNVDSLIVSFYSDDMVVAVFLDTERLLFPTDTSTGSTAGWYENSTTMSLTNSYNPAKELAVGDHSVTLVILNNNQNHKTNPYQNTLNPSGIAGKITIGGTTGVEIPPPTTPEPATMLIIGLGTLGAGFAARRRVKK